MINYCTAMGFYEPQSCSSLYRLPRFINCPTYITLHYNVRTTVLAYMIVLYNTLLSVCCRFFVVSFLMMNHS